MQDLFSIAIVRIVLRLNSRQACGVFASRYDQAVWLVLVLFRHAKYTVSYFACGQLARGCLPTGCSY